MKYLRKIVLSKPFIIAVAVILIYTLFGFLLAPYLVRHYVPKIARERLKRDAAVGVVRINPYIFIFEANDFQMTEPNGQPMVGFKRLLIDFELKSLFKWAWTFRQVSLEGLDVHAVIEKNGTLNLATLAPPSAPSSQEEKNGEPTRLIVEDIRIEQGRIEVTDRRQSEPAAVVIHPLALQMKHLNTLPEQEGAQALTATTVGGERFKWTGNVSLNPVSVKGRFSVEDLRISTLSQFARDTLNLENPDGKIKVSGQCEVDLAGGQDKVLITDLSVALTGIGLRLQTEENPFLELPEILLSGGRLDLSGRKAEIGTLTVNGGMARLAVNEDGTLNVQRIAKTRETKVQAESVQGSGSPWRVALQGLDVDGLAAEYTDLSRTPGLRAGVDRLKVRLKAEAELGDQTHAALSDIGVGISGLHAAFPDSSEPPVRVEKVGLEGGAYDMGTNRFTADAISIENGVADLRREGDGNLNLAVLFGQLEKGKVAKTYEEAAGQGNPFGFLVKTVSLSGMQAAFSDLLVLEGGPLFHLEDVSATAFDVDGRSPMKFDLSIRVREGGRIEAAGTVDPSAPSVESEIRVADLGLPPFQPYIRKAAEVILQSGTFSTKGTLRHGIKSAGAQTAYEGGFDLQKLRVTEADGDETLVGWQSLKSDQLKLQLGPDGVEIAEASLSRLAGKIIIEKDKRLNLVNVIKSDPKPQREERQSAPSTEGAFPYRVGRVVVTEGRVDFADLSLPLPFGTKIHELKGIVAGISSTKNARAQVKLDGRVDEYGTAKVDGELNTSDPKAFTDIGVIFRNVEMSRLTPYSGKFAGRKIDSGKLSVDLKYKIDQGVLAGDNQIVVERLVLGEKVESPDAVNLPLDFAVALLEDSNGVIELGLPVHGNLDSPEFSYGALIGKAIVNLIMKVVTSPFRALAALIPGGGEETFKNVFFEPGRAEIPPPEKEKLAKLAGVLKKRPQLKLSVQGGYDPERDGWALRTAGLIRALAARLGGKLTPDMDPGLVDYSDPETGKVLEAMFSERFGADALKALKADLKATREKAEKELSSRDKSGSRDSGAEDPGLLAKRLFARLEAVEPVDQSALARLAEARAQAVIAELSGTNAIAGERLGTKPSAALEESDKTTAALTLEPMR